MPNRPRIPVQERRRRIRRRWIEPLPLGVLDLARVVGSDIYDLDRDGDGLAWEPSRTPARSLQTACIQLRARPNAVSMATERTQRASAAASAKGSRGSLGR